MGDLMEESGRKPRISGCEHEVRPTGCHERLDERRKREMEMDEMLLLYTSLLFFPSSHAYKHGCPGRARDIWEPGSLALSADFVCFNSTKRLFSFLFSHIFLLPGMFMGAVF